MVAHGVKGKPLSPDEEIAAIAFPGIGVAALHPSGATASTPTRGRRGRGQEDVGSPKKKAKKGAQQRLRERLQNTESKGKGKGRGKGRGKGKGSGRGQGPTSSRAEDECCNNWNRGLGACASAAAGSNCPNRRKHACSKCGEAHKSTACTRG